MMRFHFFFVSLIIPLIAHTGLEVPDRPKDEAVFEKDIYADAQAWQFSGVDLAKDQVATITAKGQWKSNAIWKQKFGAGGNPKTKSSMTYLKPGSREGCLLIRSGDKILAFSGDGDTIVIKTAGKIYFCINDEPTVDGVTRFKEQLEGKKGKHYVGAIPIPAPNAETSGAGFLDNTGSLRVLLVVKKAEK